MFYLKKTIEISCGHKLNLDYESKCNNRHGHNYTITVYCKSSNLDRNNMVIDFDEIKKVVMSYDHKDLNELIMFEDIKNITTEILAKIICNDIPFCYKVKIKENKNNTVVYKKD